MRYITLCRNNLLHAASQKIYQQLAREQVFSAYHMQSVDLCMGSGYKLRLSYLPKDIFSPISQYIKIHLLSSGSRES